MSTLFPNGVFFGIVGIVAPSIEALAGAPAPGEGVSFRLKGENRLKPQPERDSASPGRAVEPRSGLDELGVCAVEEVWFVGGAWEFR